MSVRKAPHEPDEGFEPYEEHRGIPLPVYWIAIALAIWGGIMLFHNDAAIRIGRAERAQRAVEAPRHAIATGADIFAARCSTCHQDNALGVGGAIPPLAGSPFVAARPEVVTGILLRGIDGAVRVGSHTYDGHMPSFASVLSDREIASVVNHVRRTWGNASMNIDASFVARERGRFASHEAWQGGLELATVFGGSLSPQPVWSPPGAPAIAPAIGELIANGRGEAWSCASCHGARGQGNGTIPRLAGLPAAYIAKQLADFSAGRRDSETMAIVAKSLTPGEMAGLGQYYAGLRAPSTAAPSLGGDLKRGQQLALQGDWSKKVPSCFSCHGPSGFGVAPEFPALAAQHPAYTAGQLAAWVGGTRDNSPQHFMNGIAGALTDDDRRAVADYLSTLPPVPAAAVPRPANRPIAH